jgi:hypothetical protein
MLLHVLDDVPMENQHFGKLEFVSVLRRLSNDRPHDVDVYNGSLNSIIGLLASSCEFVYIVDAPQEVVYHFQKLQR